MKISIKPTVTIRPSNPQRPATAVWREGRWHLRVDYPETNELAGTYVVLSPDGSASQLVIDNEGNLIDEFNLNQKEKSKE